MKKILLYFLIIAFYFLFNYESIFAMTGSGTASDPYVIYDCMDLQNMNQSLTSSYELANDIDCSATSGWNGGKGFDPIGNWDKEFLGKLNGKGNKIFNLTINRPTESHVGLFSLLKGGSLENIGLENASIVGSNFTGGLAGNITSTFYLNNVYSTGVILGKDDTGGIAGIANGSGIFISNSYSLAKVMGQIEVGGFFGRGYIGNITNSFSTGNVSGSSDTGGLIGYYFGLNITSSYYDKDTSGKSDTGKGVGLTTSNMKIQSSYVGWDFTNVWGIDSSINNGYPYLKVFIPDDSTPPAEVVALAETHDYKSATLTWTNPTDSDFSHVKILRDGVEIANNITDTQFQDDSLDYDTDYIYKIITVDINGNESTGIEIPVTTNGILELLFPVDNIDFGSITLNGTEQILFSDIGTLSISDTTNSSAGWNVVVSAMPLIQNGGARLSLPNGSLSLKEPDLISQTEGNSPPPQVTNTSWILDNGSAVKILYANPNEGEGKYEISFPNNALSLILNPENTYIDENETSGTIYQSTLSWSIVSGP